MATTDPSKPTEPAPMTVEEIGDILKRAAKGDESTVPALRRLLEKPGNIDQMGGNLARYAQGLFVTALSGKDLTVREAIHAKLDAIRKELLGESPTPVERLLVERVVACWLQVQDADIRYAGAKEPTSRQSEFNQRRMDAANKRYLAALKALALVRKLAVPMLQVNIAKKQVNVLAGASTPATD